MPHIYRSTGSATIDITLTNADFKMDWQGFLDRVKLFGGWRYNEDEKIWSIPNTDENYSHLATLIDEFLRVKNPLEIAELF
jgi:hypothetical protein